MDINLKSSAGRAFNVSFDPVTVAALVGLATYHGMTAERNRLIQRINEGIEDGQLDNESASRLETLALVLSPMVGPANTSEPMKAFEEFSREYQLLSTGAGSEKTCMEAFWSLCASLQVV